MISEYFPQVPPAFGKAEVAEVSAMEQKAEVAEDCDTRVDKQPEVAPCGCPTRISAPQPPKLPFRATEANRPKIKDFLLRYYN